MWCFVIIVIAELHLHAIFEIVFVYNCLTINRSDTVPIIGGVGAVS